MTLHALARLVALVAAAALVALYGHPWMSGWRQLAWAYEFRSTFDGEKRRFQDAWMRFGGRYRLTVGVNREGLYLSPWTFALPGYPPLLIPWGEIEARPWKRWWITGTELRFRQAPSVPVRIRRSLADWLRQAAGDLWPEGKQMSS